MRRLMSCMAVGASFRSCMRASLSESAGYRLVTLRAEVLFLGDQQGTEVRGMSVVTGQAFTFDRRKMGRTAIG